MITESKPLFSGKAIAKIALPLIFQNILSITIGLADSIMVSSRGETAYAGVALIGSLDTLLITLFSAIASGGSIVLAQAMGKKDRDLACRSAKQLLYVTTAIATTISAVVLSLQVPIVHLLFGKAEEAVIKSALTYFNIIAISFPFLAIENSIASVFRAQGDSVISLKISIFMNFLNIGGNAILIYLVNLGVAGAALATLLSRMIGAAIMVIISHNKKRYIYIEKLFRYRPDKKIIKALLSIGIPNGVENSLFQFGRLMTSSLVSSLGTVAIAANAAALSLANFQYNAGGAIHSTIVAVVGRCIGAREEAQAKKYAKILVGVGYFTIITVAGLLCILSAPLLGLFNLSTESFETARRLIFYHSAVSAVIWVVAFCLPNAFRAANDIRFTMVVSVFSMWMFRVALAYILAQDTVSVWKLFSFPGMGLGVMGVWIAMTVDWVARTVFFLHRFLSGKWLTKYKQTN